MFEYMTAQEAAECWKISVRASATALQGKSYKRYPKYKSSLAYS